jgi:hypothetical protein
MHLRKREAIPLATARVTSTFVLFRSSVKSDGSRGFGIESFAEIANHRRTRAISPFVRLTDSAAFTLHCSAGGIANLDTDAPPGLIRG